MVPGSHWSGSSLSPRLSRIGRCVTAGPASGTMVQAMSRQPISPHSRELLGGLRNLLLEQHKLLLDRERAQYEAINGPVGGAGQFLALVLGDPHFAWLRVISSLVVDIDEALSRRSTADQPAAESLKQRAAEIMRPREDGTDFQIRYFNAVQESPDIIILQCRIERLLNL